MSYLGRDRFVIEGAMAASVPTAVAAPQMVALGQDELAAFHVKLIVF